MTTINMTLSGEASDAYWWIGDGNTWSIPGRSDNNIYVNGRSDNRCIAGFQFIPPAGLKGMQVDAATLTIGRGSAASNPTTINLILASVLSPSPVTQVWSDAFPVDDATAQTSPVLAFNLPSNWLSISSWTLPDFSNVIQELINRPSWSDTNRIALLIFADGVQDGFFTISEGSAALSITYSEPPPPPPSDDTEILLIDKGRKQIIIFNE